MYKGQEATSNSLAHCGNCKTVSLTGASDACIVEPRVRKPEAGEQAFLENPTLAERRDKVRCI
jgi:hypothetical protein